VTHRIPGGVILPPVLTEPHTPEPQLDPRDLKDREWYHTLELGPGMLTPGWFDTRKVARRLPFPSSLAGKRCLDIGTFDGFWAFEMERRGADEVVAVDVLDPAAFDWPADSTPEAIAALDRRKDRGLGFEIARRALGSRVQRLETSVYELDPAIVGRFDFVYLGSLLLHLRDPVRALEQVRSVCSGSLLVVDGINLSLTLAHPRRPVAALEGLGRPWWWKMNLAALVRVVRSSGFELSQRPALIRMPPGRGHPRARISAELLRSVQARELFVAALGGDPHAAILARPASRANAAG
jgi:tRNA (mo5U34)-methyltransferase